MRKSFVIPCGKHDARFEIINSASGDMLGISFWTWSAKAGFHQPHSNIVIDAENLPIIIDGLQKFCANSL